MKRVIQLVVSASLVALLLSWIDLASVASALRGFDPRWLLAIVPVMAFDRVLMAFKWNLLLRSQGLQIPLWTVVRIYLTSSFVGQFLPATVGTDMVRTILVRRRGFAMAPAVASMLMERIIGIGALLVFGLVGVFLHRLFYSGMDTELDPVFELLIALGLIFALGVGFSLREGSAQFVQSLLGKLKGRPWATGVLNRLGRLYTSYLSFRDRKGTLALFFLLTMLETLVIVLASYLVARSIGVSVSMLYFTSFVPIILVVVRLPISIMGIGINELGYVIFLTSVGVDEALGLATGVLVNLVYFATLLPGAALLATDRRARAIRAAASTAETADNAPPKTGSTGK